MCPNLRAANSLLSPPLNFSAERFKKGMFVAMRCCAAWCFFLRMDLRSARQSRSVCLVGGRQGPRRRTKKAGDATPSGRGVRQEAGIARRGGDAHGDGKSARMAHVARRGAAWIARRGGTPALPQLVRLVFCVVCARPIARDC